MSTIVLRYLGKSRYVEELIEDWQIAYRKAQVSWDVQDLAVECIELGKLANQTWDFLVDSLASEDAPMDYEAIRASMTIAFEKTLHNFRTVQRLTKEIDRLACPPIDDAEEFDKVTTATQRIFEEFKEQWPSLEENIDTEMVKEALASYSRGEYLTPEALLDDTRGKGPEID